MSLHMEWPIRGGNGQFLLVDPWSGNYFDLEAAKFVKPIGSILTRTASPHLQSLVFIPKADQGEYADNYRPLGLPNTCDRILDRSIYSPFSHCLLGALHPAQALLNLFREPQFNYLDIQHFLDNAMHLHSSPL